jgi:GNAT superfamily N-acetyltransferase
MVIVRPALPVDAPTIARHRAAMFADMGVLRGSSREELIDATLGYLREALPRGEYVGWLASDREEPDDILGGVGLQLRRGLPFPMPLSGEGKVATGRQGIVLNLYIEPESRRAGIARAVMERVIDWARATELESLVLHASDAGRRMYERLGFISTNEMRFAESLRGRESESLRGRESEATTLSRDVRE